MTDIKNLRIHFYGVQGSGSIFPSRAERQVTQLHSDLQLLQRVFDDLGEHVDADGKLSVSLEDVIGGSPDRDTLTRYRNSLDLEEQRSYGGWTTCCRIETSDGYDIVIDCGSGFRVCAGDIVDKWTDTEDRHLYILGTHAHYDHTEGFDQAAVCFDPKNNIHILANRTYLRSLDQNLGIFSHYIDMNLKGVQTPLTYELMPARFDSCEIRDLQKDPAPADPDPMIGRYHDVNEPIELGQTSIQPIEVFHPNPCLAYRIEHNGKVFIFCTDHELRWGDDPDDPLQIASEEAEQRLIQQSMNADLMYRDGQFLRIEYDGQQGIGTPIGVSRKGWGHSCIEDVMEMAIQCNVAHTMIGHHDPNRTWSERSWIDEILVRKSQQTGLKLELARAETVIDL